MPVEELSEGVLIAVTRTSPQHGVREGFEGHDRLVSARVFRFPARLILIERSRAGPPAGFRPGGFPDADNLHPASGRRFLSPFVGRARRLS
ncbi:hypothetical protein GCM10009780_19410 [Actinomadura alba]